MGNNRNDKDSVDDFRKTLADLIQMNDRRGSPYPNGTPASKPRHPPHQQVYARHDDKTNPGMPRHLTETPPVAAPPSQHRHAASRTHIPARTRASRQEMFENQMSSVMAKHSQHASADSGMKVQAGLFAVGLLAACSATFALVYYLVADDRVTQASSHFQAQTAQAISSADSGIVSNNTTGNNQVAAGLVQPQTTVETVGPAAGIPKQEVRANAASANAKALSDIANGNWLVLPSDTQKQAQTDGSASVQQQIVRSEPTDTTVLTRQELFESFQSYLERTGLAPVTDNPHQEALFNSFVRWNVEVAKAN